MNDASRVSLEERPFFTVAQIAERWLCSERTIRREIKRGRLVAHRIGVQLRISHADLIAYERLCRAA